MAKKYWTLLTFGLPYSGKSSMATKLKEEYQFRHVNLGEILRKLVKNPDESDEYKIIYRAVTTGAMVGSKYIKDIIYHELAQSVENHVIFDGFPRYGEAKEDFYFLMSQFSRSMSKILLLHFIISPEKSLSFQKLRNRKQGNDVQAMKNRISHYFDNEIVVYRKLKENHNFIELYRETGIKNNFEIIKTNLFKETSHG